MVLQLLLDQGLRIKEKKNGWKTRQEEAVEVEEKERAFEGGDSKCWYNDGQGKRAGRPIGEKKSRCYVYRRQGGKARSIGSGYTLLYYGMDK